MDMGSIALAAACMIGMCVVGMWLMMRMGSRGQKDKHRH
jgi:hypothetical protein